MGKDEKLPKNFDKGIRKALTFNNLPSSLSKMLPAEWANAHAGAF